MLPSNVQPPPATVIQPGSFSIRQLMLLILTLASGMALTRLEAFAPTDGLFAIASIFVAAGLRADIKHLRRTPQIRRVDRGIQICWRWLLLTAIVLYFLLVYLAHVQSGLFGSQAMFEQFAFAPQIMLQLAFFSCLMLNAPLPGKSSRLLVVALFLALVIVALSIRVGFLPVVFLVQVAVEAMELGSSRNVHFGPISQYAPDSGGMFAGVDSNLARRATRFGLATMVGVIPFVLFVPSACWMIAKLRRRESYTRAFKITTGLALASMVYPVWVYTHGLRQFSPPFAEAGIQMGITSFVCAAMTLLVVAFTFAYRAVAVETRLEHDATLNWNSMNNNATLFFLALANAAWFVGDIGKLGVDGPLISISLRFVDFEAISELLARPGGLVAVAVVFLVLQRWLKRVLLYWKSEPPPLDSSSVGSVDLRSMSVVGSTILLMIVLAAPTIWWFAYAINTLYMRRA